MQCPKCRGSRLTPNDKKHHRWECIDCGCTFTPNPKKSGRKPLGDRPMTSAERKRRSRQIKRLLEDN